MSEQKRLFLVDAYALIFRGYYAFIKNPRINSKGLDTSAIMGFMNSLLDVIKRERPGYLAVCFDKGGSKDRAKIFKEYKSNRDETPEAIKIAVPYIQKILEYMHIPIVEKEGFEADDIIGTLSKQAEKEGYRTYMVTPDKDFAQLVSKNIFMYKPRFKGGYDVWGIEEVNENFGTKDPLQVIDYLAMVGDTVDNIPGLSGVGVKTAKKFLAQFETIEQLLDNTHKLKGKLKEKIEANVELGLLSKKLATIMLDVPVEFDAKNYELIKPDIEKVTQIFNELEFRNLLTNFLKSFSSENSSKEDNLTKNDSPKPKEESKNTSVQFELFDLPGGGNASQKEITLGFKTIKSTSHFYQLISTPVARKLLINKLLQQESVCFDTQTVGLKSLESKLIGIAFSYDINKGYYVSFPENQEETKSILEEFRPFFEAESIEKIGHNLKHDLKVLSNYNIKVQGKIFDTMVAHYLINPDMRHNMDILSETYLNYKPLSINELVGKKGINQLAMSEIPVLDKVEYAVECVDITLQLKQHFIKELKSNNAIKLFDEIEMPLVYVLTAMEVEGINIDTTFLKNLSHTLNEEIKNLKNSIFSQANEEFNLNSPKQLGVILFDKLKLDKPKKTKTGQYSTAENVLTHLAKDHKIVEEIQEYRQYEKLLNTYIDSLPKNVNSKTKRIHTEYSQAVAATGRLSSNNPNLQNIPIKTSIGKEIRKAFIPKDENHVLLAADYSQIELRIIASLSCEEEMINDFKKGKDIHASTAAKVFKVPLDKVTRIQRNNAKIINFGVIYGVSAFGLSNQSDLNRSQSQEFINTYYQAYPSLKKYMAKQVDFARENGYVETVLKRRRYLKNINSRNSIVRGAAERNAINAPIQGSAADIIKLAMIDIFNAFNKEKIQSKMILQVHDELVFEAKREELEIIKPIIKDKMENAFKMLVPLDVEIGIGDNWLESH